MSKIQKLAKTTAFVAFAFTAITLLPYRSQAQTVPVRGIEHVGINVPNMDEAIRFFHTTFGFKPVTEMNDVPVDDGFRKLFHMHDGAKVKSIVMLRAGNGANLELFQYDSPKSTKEQPSYDDAGAAHVGFYTDDIVSAVAELRAKGITVLTDPITMSHGPTAGESWTYFLTPWGAKMELVSYPKGEAYEQQAGSIRLWTPSSNGILSPTTLTNDQAQTLASEYLPLFNETDSGKRILGLSQYFSSEVSFFDPEGVFVGIGSLNTLIDTLQSRNPSWHFKQIGKASVAGNTVRVPWQYGPNDAPDKILGEDILTLRDTKIVSLSVFLLSVK